MDAIVPPRLEDAGLEDCALPPELIMEAFYKAAAVVKSRASSIFAGAAEVSPSPDIVVGELPEANPGEDLVVRGEGVGAGDCLKPPYEVANDKVKVLGEEDNDPEAVSFEDESGDDAPTLIEGCVP